MNFSINLCQEFGEHISNDSAQSSLILLFPP